MQNSRTKSFANLALYAGFILVAVVAYSETANFPRPLLPGYPGSAMFPRFTLVLMAAFSAIGIALELVRLMRARPGAKAPKPKSDISAKTATGSVFYDLLIVLVPLAICIAAIDWLGMEVGVFGFVAAMIYFVTQRALASILAGVGTVLVVYFVFVQGLSVAMPLTFLPHYLTW